MLAFQFPILWQMVVGMGVGVNINNSNINSGDDNVNEDDYTA